MSVSSMKQGCDVGRGSNPQGSEKDRRGMAFGVEAEQEAPLGGQEPSVTPKPATSTLRAMSGGELGQVQSALDNIPGSATGVNTAGTQGVGDLLGAERGKPQMLVNGAVGVVALNAEKEPKPGFHIVDGKIRNPLGIINKFWRAEDVLLQQGLEEGKGGGWDIDRKIALIAPLRVQLFNLLDKIVNGEDVPFLFNRLNRERKIFPDQKLGAEADPLR